MKDEIKEILDKLKTCIYEDDWFEIDEINSKILLDYITNLQEKLDKQSKNSYECGYKAGLIQAEIDNTMGVIEENSRLKLIIKALHKYFTEHEEYETNEFLRQLENCTENDMVWLKRMAGDDNIA